MIMAAIVEVTRVLPVKTGRTPFSLWLMAGAAAMILLSGCSTVGNAWQGTKNTVGGWFSDDDAATTETASTGEGAPSLSTVPTEAPVPPSTAAQRTGTVEGLVSDRARAQYTEQGGRREPVNVRPLDETVSTPDRVNMPAPTRADVAAIPSPAATAPSAPMAPQAMTPAPMAAPSAMPSSATLVPAPTQVGSYTAGYGFETVVIGGGGPAAPARVPGGFRDLASYGGSNSVSSQIVQVVFASGSTISAADKRALADAASLRADANGILRVVAAGSDAAAANRASAVARELQRLGVPTDRMYVGTDAMAMGGTADVFLDY